MQHQKKFNYYIDLNINNKTVKKYHFTNKDKAFYFFLNCLKESAKLHFKKSAHISAILYQQNNMKKHVLLKQNLTKVFNTNAK